MLPNHELKETKLHWAARTGNVELLRKLILVDDENGNVEALDMNASTPIFEACRHNHLDIVKILLKEKNADIVIRNRLGESPLLLACKHGNIELTLLLFEHLQGIISLTVSTLVTYLHCNLLPISMFFRLYFSVISILCLLDNGFYQ
jgi:ankyrin repeat protein